ncbi:MAG TPA: heavy metal translocating P-type ATPase [Miltoncostaeaceae bacterium]|nr:heavy metal translocating P-type ATPase [Miltoncostaeaceae bacterium]
MSVAPSPAAPPSEGAAAAWARLGDAPAMLLPALTAAGVVIGGVVAAAGGDGAAVWRATAIVVLVPLAWSVVRTLSRRALGVDVIALIAIVGALALGEELVAAVIALMLSGGNALERYAARRSRRELTALLARAPHSARLRRDGGLVEVAVERVAPGDLLLVRAGEVLPVDGIVESAVAELDESALTGEPLPRSLSRGDAVRSGTTNAGAALDLRATRPAAESAYAAIVRLVQEAGARRAPFVRMADRYAVLFLAVTLALAAIAWASSGDPVRALAVLVVATPCPLILAAPVALVSGVSRAARRGIIVKGAPVIEALGGARTVLLDKTGTLTIGTPSVASITASGGRSEDEVLGPAAAVEQLSPHVLAAAIVREARRRGLELPLPERVVEDPGRGVEGTVGGVRVAAGSADWLRGRGCDLAAGPPAGGPADGHATVLVALDGRLAGALARTDSVRPDAPALVGRLRRAGVEEIAIVTGDDPATAAEVARRVGIAGVHAGQTPASKLALVEAERRRAGGTVVMVGDGVNDAPALAAADVGIAMGGAGATASSEAADAVIIDDRVERVAEAVELGRRSLGIARQSVVAGMALSGAAMIAAAAGFLPPLAGALLQEAIDVAVIANALRALRGP